MNDGFENEDKIISALHNKSYEDLNDNLKRLIDSCFSNFSGTINCFKIAGQDKSDLEINIGNESHTFSIKKGSGNSVHQEPLEDFLNYLDQFNIDNTTKNHIRHFIWGDGTLNNTGNISDRISAPTYKNKFPNSINSIQAFFDNNIYPIVKRCLVQGAVSNSSPDYFYYGDENKGKVCSATDLINYVCSNKNNRAVISLGKLSFQAWNRNIKGGKSSEKKRGFIQLKWGTIGKDIQSI